MVFKFNPGCNCCGGCLCYTDYTGTAITYYVYSVRFSDWFTQDSRTHALNYVRFNNTRDTISGGFVRKHFSCPWSYNAGLLQTNDKQRLKIYSGASLSPYTESHFDDMGGRSGVLFECSDSGSLSILDSSGTVTSGGSTFNWSDAICDTYVNPGTGSLYTTDVFCDGQSFFESLPSEWTTAHRVDVTISGCTDLGLATYSQINGSHTFGNIDIGFGQDDVIFEAPSVGDGWQPIIRFLRASDTTDVLFCYIRINPAGFFLPVFWHYSPLTSRFTNSNDVGTYSQIPDRSGGQITSISVYTV